MKRIYYIFILNICISIIGFGQNSLVCDSMSTPDTVIQVSVLQDTVYFDYNYSGPNSGVPGGIYVSQIVNISDTTYIKSIERLEILPVLSSYVYPNQTYPLLLNYSNVTIPASYTLNCSFEIFIGTSGETCYIPFELVFNQNTDVIEGNKNIEFKIFPNPFQETINITGQKNTYTVKLIDIAGKTVFKQEVSNNQSVLHLSGINQGTYILGIYDEEGELVFIEKIYKAQ